MFYTLINFPETTHNIDIKHIHEDELLGVFCRRAQIKVY